MIVVLADLLINAIQCIQILLPAEGPATSIRVVHSINILNCIVLVTK